jgi:hypothetical protein
MAFAMVDEAEAATETTNINVVTVDAPDGPDPIRRLRSRRPATHPVVPVYQADDGHHDEGESGVPAVAPGADLVIANEAPIVDPVPDRTVAVADPDREVPNEMVAMAVVAAVAIVAIEAAAAKDKRNVSTTPKQMKRNRQSLMRLLLSVEKAVDNKERPQNWQLQM